MKIIVAIHLGRFRLEHTVKLQVHERREKPELTRGFAIPNERRIFWQICDLTENYRRQEATVTQHLNMLPVYTVS